MEIIKNKVLISCLTFWIGMEKLLKKVFTKVVARKKWKAFLREALNVQLERRENYIKKVFKCFNLMLRVEKAQPMVLLWQSFCLTSFQLETRWVLKCLRISCWAELPAGVGSISARRLTAPGTVFAVLSLLITTALLVAASTATGVAVAAIAAISLRK